MAYRFFADSTVEDNVHRLLQEQIEKAIHQLTHNFQKDPARSIHDARKRLKKARSVLRLIRKSIDKDTYKREKNVLRDVGRSLAPARDAEAYQSTLDALLEAYELTLDISAFSDLKASLAGLHTVRLGKLIEHEDTLQNLVGELKDSHTRLQQLALQATGWDALARSLHRIYRQGHERFHAAYETNNDEAFHEWRKRVKDFWYDMRLLRRLWPPVMSAFEEEGHRLSSLLGDSHDIAELRHFLHHHSEEVALVETQKNVLWPLMEHRQYKLHQPTRELGQKLFAEEPDAFTDRIASYWENWFTEI
ncbi:CHAD domain-containing protein [Leptolyngbya iicbica]|uniref:CHAD domain-containing protein n=2 Tax=Cyanophyceae TaxID=3028117 RepID=A0A4Q7E7U6_9CYAN|nr:CHAD domain-containing protein [Leptolyngbya sp. LK]RZM78652.1 CHAD domain-containing protein [Leptolyngbya sp. LK]